MAARRNRKLTLPRAAGSEQYVHEPRKWEQEKRERDVNHTEHGGVLLNRPGVGECQLAHGSASCSQGDGYEQQVGKGSALLRSGGNDEVDQGER
jgi:hypothetical protein